VDKPVAQATDVYSSSGGSYGSTQANQWLPPLLITIIMRKLRSGTSSDAISKQEW
jgi:hypothetical protein